MKTQGWKYIVITMLSLWTLTSCSPGPEKTAQKFTEYMATHQFDEAKKYCTESTANWIDLAANLDKFGSKNKELATNYKFKCIKDSVVDKEAWIDYIDTDGDTARLHVVKIDGKWLVDEGGK